MSSVSGKLKKFTAAARLSSGMSAGECRRIRCDE
jgi:hypothetical protein